VYKFQVNSEVRIKKKKIRSQYSNTGGFKAQDPQLKDWLVIKLIQFYNFKPVGLGIFEYTPRIESVESVAVLRIRRKEC
jgi:hypothetical protein